MPTDKKPREVVIIGAGPAGLSAAIYTTREDIDTLVFERGVIGGLAAVTDKIDNYPGFADGVEGLMLSDQLKKQAERFGAEIELGVVTAIHDHGELKKLTTTSGDIYTKVVLIATGSDYKKVGVPGEDTYYARGVHYCATCDGAFYRNVPVCVIGGGDTATEEAIFLTRFASEVFLIHRRDTLRATKIMVERALNNPKIKPIWSTAVSRYIPDQRGEIEAVELRNVETGAFSNLAVKCVFVAIGHTPNTGPFKGKIEMDANGYLIKRKGTQTSLPGVFAAGDVADPFYRQAVTAAGQGCAAAMEVERYLTDLE